MTRGPAAYPISDEQIATAKRMRGLKKSFRSIARELGVPYETLRNRIDPGYFEQRRAVKAAYNKAIYRDIPKRPQVRNGNEEARNPKYDPRIHGAPQYRSQYSEMLGEPPVGRSALDAMNLAPRDPKEDRSSFIDPPFGVGPD